MGLIDQLVFTNLEKSFNAIFQQTNMNQGHVALTMSCGFQVMGII